MKYFKITTEKEAEVLSRTMYKMMYPDGADVQTTHLFGWLTNEKGECVIKIEQDLKPIFKKTSYTTDLKKIEELTGELTDMATKEEINTGKVYPAKLLNGLEEVDEQYLLDNGFIKEKAQ